MDKFRVTQHGKVLLSRFWKRIFEMELKKANQILI